MTSSCLLYLFLPPFIIKHGPSNRKTLEEGKPSKKQLEAIKREARFAYKPNLVKKVCNKAFFAQQVAISNSVKRLRASATAIGSAPAIPAATTTKNVATPVTAEQLFPALFAKPQDIRELPKIQKRPSVGPSADEPLDLSQQNAPPTIAPPQPVSALNDWAATLSSSSSSSADSSSSSSDSSSSSSSSSSSESEDELLIDEAVDIGDISDASTDTRKSATIPVLATTTATITATTTTATTTTKTATATSLKSVVIATSSFTPIKPITHLFKVGPQPIYLKPKTIGQLNRGKPQVVAKPVTNKTVHWNRPRSLPTAAVPPLILPLPSFARPAPIPKPKGPALPPPQFTQEQKECMSRGQRKRLAHRLKVEIARAKVRDELAKQQNQ